MRSVFLLIFLGFLCPFTSILASVVPSEPVIVETVAPAVPAAAILISADAPSVQVGGTLTLTGVPVNVGLAYYTFTLSSGATATVTYDNQVRGALGTDSLFEIVSATGEMNRVTFVLRALAPGSAEAVISATGEVRTPEGAFSWGNAASEALVLTVSD